MPACAARTCPLKQWRDALPRGPRHDHIGPRPLQAYRRSDATYGWLTGGLLLDQDRLAGVRPARISRYRRSVSAEGLMPRTTERSSRQRLNALTASAWSPVAANERINPR